MPALVLLNSNSHMEQQLSGLHGHGNISPTLLQKGKRAKVVYKDSKQTDCSTLNSHLGWLVSRLGYHCVVRRKEDIFQFGLMGTTI